MKVKTNDKDERMMTTSHPRIDEMNFSPPKPTTCQPLVIFHSILSIFLFLFLPCPSIL